MAKTNVSLREDFRDDAVDRVGLDDHVRSFDLTLLGKLVKMQHYIVANIGVNMIESCAGVLRLSRGRPRAIFCCNDQAESDGPLASGDQSSVLLVSHKSWLANPRLSVNCSAGSILRC